MDTFGFLNWIDKQVLVVPVIVHDEELTHLLVGRIVDHSVEVVDEKGIYVLFYFFCDFDQIDAVVLERENLMVPNTVSAFPRANE